MSDKFQQPIIVSPQEYKAQQIAESKRLAAESDLDEGPEGGRYMVGDQAVNANGEPVKDGPKGAEGPTGAAGVTGATGPAGMRRDSR